MHRIAPPHSKTQALVFRGQTNSGETRLTILRSSLQPHTLLQPFRFLGKSCLLSSLGRNPLESNLRSKPFRNIFVNHVRKSCGQYTAGPPAGIDTIKIHQTSGMKQGLHVFCIDLNKLSRLAPELHSVNYLTAQNP